MVFGLVMTFILLLSGLSLFRTGIGRMIPAGVRIVPFLELGLLWLCLLVLRGRWTGALVMVQFWVVFALMILPSAGGLWILESFDRERRIGPLGLGNPSGSKEILAVFHPGASDFTASALRELGACCSNTPYKLVLYSARRGLRLDLRQAAAVVFASPIYAGSIRPPVTHFLERTDLSGVRCVLLLTGSAAAADQDFGRAVPFVEARGGKIIAKTKVLQGKQAPALRDQMRPFFQDLLARLDQI